MHFWCVAANLGEKEQMRMKLVLAEKLSIAQSTAKVLGASKILDVVLPEKAVLRFVGKSGRSCIF